MPGWGPFNMQTLTAEMQKSLEIAPTDEVLVTLTGPEQQSQQGLVVTQDIACLLSSGSLVTGFAEEREGIGREGESVCERRLQLGKRVLPWHLGGQSDAIFK